MTHSTRRAVGAVASVSILVAALLLTRVLIQRQRDSAEDRARHLAPLTLQSASQELRKRLESVEGRVTSAVSLNPVRALVGQQVDANTFRDSFQTEEWWRSVRSEFPIHELFFGERMLDFSSPAVGSFNARPLAAAALKKSPSSQLISADAKVYLASASVVDVPVPGATSQPVMVLAKALDAQALESIAERLGGAVLLTNGHTVWLEAGPPTERSQLQALIGQEAEPIQVRESWASAAGELAPGVWIWTYSDTAALAEQAAAALTVPLVALWIGAGALVVLALVIGFRRGRAEAELALKDKSAELERTKAALERLSRQYVIPKEVQAMNGGLASNNANPPPAPGATSPPPSSAPAANAALAQRYQLLEQLGEGGMARVYLAVSYGAEGFRRLFVVKKLREELARQSDAVMQFVDEARLGASLVHSNIVPIYDFGKIGDEYFMAQEYILGRDLDVVGRRMKERERKRLDPSLIFYVAQETLKGLGYAHSRADATGVGLGIVHRDVSPMNIMISARGEVKLFDFGIVKAEGRKSQTQHGVVKGNVLFMSPEQARGAYQIDGRADLFSLGLTIFWCLTGETLYRGDTTYDLLMRAAKGPGGEEWDRIQQLPGPAAQVLQRALQPAPGDRFQTADEFGAALPPVGMGGAASSLRNLVQRLFGEDFQREERRVESSSTRAQPGPRPESEAPASGDRLASPSR